MMNKFWKLIILSAFAGVLCACSNIPQVPTKTPTMSAEELMQAAQETAESMRRETETQWAMDNPSPTPTKVMTSTPTPPPVVKVIPPTATEAPLPYLRVGHTNYTVYKIGDPGDYEFHPMDNLYVEICYTNEGSGTWNENYYCQVVRQGGSVILPDNANKLGKNVNTGEKACFSFTRQGSPNTALGNQCSAFQLYMDTGTAISNGYVSACWTIK